MNKSDRVIFPQVYGNEEETGLLINVGGQLHDPFHFCEELEYLTPDGLIKGDVFLSNGFKAYSGGSKSNHMTHDYDNFERATPECSSPSQLTTYIRASERLVFKYLQKYMDYEEYIEGARIQRRVVDAYGNRKASHDSFGLHDTNETLQENTILQHVLMGHLASRSCITGSGLVGSKEISFAQKIDGLSAVKEYGYFGSMYRIDIDDAKDPTSACFPRFETRCGDINISDFACRHRIGMTALMLAIGQTQCAGKLLDKIDIHSANAINIAKGMNRLAITDEGHITVPKSVIAGLDFQRIAAEYALTQLELEADYIPSELTQTALNQVALDDQLRKVFSGEETVDLLADKLDWAAKLTPIIRRFLSSGDKAALIDIEAQADDLRYDHIGISRDDQGYEVVKYGRGYRLRDRNKLLGTVPNNAVEHALYNPPPLGRAALRSEIIKKHYVKQDTWRNITIHDGENEETITLSPTQVELTDIQTTQLQQVKMR